MRIGIDARAYGWTGIGRYVRNLLLQLTSILPTLQGPWGAAELVVLIPPRYALEISELPHVRVWPVRDSYYSLYEQTGFFRQTLAARVDLMHFPNFNAPIAYQRPSVVTIHDLTRFQFTGQRHHGGVHQWAYEAVFRSAVRHAQHILAVSSFTRDALLRLFPSANEKVSVVYEGVDPQFICTAEEKQHAKTHLAPHGIPQPFILYVGLWMRHKNLRTLVRAFRLFREMGYPGSLVMTGEGRPWDEDLRMLAARAGISDAVVLPGRVSDTALAALYRAADALVCPSLVEGFGLPPLEAMASRTPVVAARAGSLPEVLGDAAVFAPANDPSAFAAALQVLHTDQQLRARLTGRGIERASMFSWGTCALQTLAAYATTLRVPLSPLRTASHHTREVGTLRLGESETRATSS